MIEAFSPTDTQAQLADWLELSVVVNGKPASDVELLAAADILDEPPHSTRDDEDSIGSELVEEEIADTRTDELRSMVWNEVRFRIEALGDSYPFEVEARSQGGFLLGLRDEGDTQSQVVIAYQLMLMISAIRRGLFPKPEEFEERHKDLVKPIPGLFQDLAVIAASSVLGESYGFGFPRLDHTGFLAALQALRSAIGLGELRSPPSTTSRGTKDGTLDVVSWRRFRDAQYGSLIVYGQVASGTNWTDKSMRSHIVGKFLDHFLDAPSQEYMTSIFIPFVAHEEDQPQKNVPFRKVLTDCARSRERDFGLVLDRLRICELLATSRSEHVVHNGSSLEDVMRRARGWIGDSLVYLDDVNS